MKLSIQKYILFLIILVFVTSTGCLRNAPEELPKETSDLLRISTRAANEGEAEENAIRSLRLIIFDATKDVQILNKEFMTADAGQGSASSSYTYFIKDDKGNYEIGELLKSVTSKY